MSSYNDVHEEEEEREKNKDDDADSILSSLVAVLIGYRHFFSFNRIDTLQH
jgi:hypothetical protein